MLEAVFSEIFAVTFLVLMHYLTGEFVWLEGAIVWIDIVMIIIMAFLAMPLLVWAGESIRKAVERGKKEKEDK